MNLSRLTPEALKAELGNRPHIDRNFYLQKIQSILHLYKIDMENAGKAITIGKVYKPESIKKYDIFTTMVCNSPHPIICFKVDTEFVYGVSMTSTIKVHNIFEIQKSRFFKGKFITNTVIKMKKEDALENFVGVYDTKKEADEFFKVLRNFYKQVMF